MKRKGDSGSPGNSNEESDKGRDSKSARPEGSAPLRIIMPTQDATPPSSSAHKLAELWAKVSAESSKVDSRPHSDSPEVSSKQEDIPSSHLTILSHHSTEHFPSDILRLFSEGNRKIAEQHEQFKEVQAEHLAKSKREILQTARVALNRMPEGQPKRALLLGVGNGLDIPLQELAETFDELTLVELNEKSTENAIKKLPPELQKKFKLVVADITGIAGELCRNSREIINISNSAEQATIELIKIINNMEQKNITESTPKLGTDYAFVSSQLVLSQLGNIPREYIQTVTESKFGVGLQSDDLSKCFKNLDNSLHKGHILYLARSVAPLGTVHFTDTYEAHKLDSVDMPVVPMVDSSIIDPVIQATFKPRSKTEWDFVQTPTHRQYRVISSSLELIGPRPTWETLPELSSRSGSPEGNGSDVDELQSDSDGSNKRAGKRFPERGFQPPRLGSKSFKPTQQRSRFESQVPSSSKRTLDALEDPSTKPSPPKRSKHELTEIDPQLMESITREDITEDITNVVNGRIMGSFNEKIQNSKIPEKVREQCKKGIPLYKQALENICNELKDKSPEERAKIINEYLKNEEKDGNVMAIQSILKRVVEAKQLQRVAEAKQLHEEARLALLPDNITKEEINGIKYIFNSALNAALSRYETEERKQRYMQNKEQIKAKRRLYKDMKTIKDFVFQDKGEDNSIKSALRRLKDHEELLPYNSENIRSAVNLIKSSPKIQKFYESP